MKPFACIFVIGATAIVASGALCEGIVEPSGQASSRPRPELFVQKPVNQRATLAYFLDEPPSDFSQSTLPPSAGEFVVARVRMMGRSAYLVGRDQSGRPSEEKLPEDLFSAQLKLLDVVSGKRLEQGILKATFGRPDHPHTYIPNPVTPEQLAKDYFVVMCEDGSGLHLVGFPISEAEYRAWEAEFLQFERTRVRRPGKQ